MEDFHVGVSSAAAEIYVASVSLNKMLHLGYVSDEMGFRFPQPIELHIDNAAAVVFSQGQTRRSKMRRIDPRQSWVEALHDDNINRQVQVGADQGQPFGHRHQAARHPDPRAAARRAHGRQGYTSSTEGGGTRQVGPSLEAASKYRADAATAA